MSDTVNPDNVNPHMQRPEEFGLKPEGAQGTGGFPQHHPQPCPHCGVCPTCDRGPWPVYTEPWWQYTPQPFTYTIPCTAALGAETVKFEVIS